MKMKNLFNQPIRRRCAALAFAVGLCGLASAPASAVSADAFSAQVSAAVHYFNALAQECQTNKRVVCPVNEGWDGTMWVRLWDPEFGATTWMAL